MKLTPSEQILVVLIIILSALVVFFAYMFITMFTSTLQMLNATEFLLERLVEIEPNDELRQIWNATLNIIVESKINEDSTINTVKYLGDIP